MCDFRWYHPDIAPPPCFPSLPCFPPSLFPSLPRFPLCFPFPVSLPCFPLFGLVLFQRCGHGSAHVFASIMILCHNTYNLTPVLTTCLIVFHVFLLLALTLQQTTGAQNRSIRLTAPRWSVTMNWWRKLTYPAERAPRRRQRRHLRDTDWSPAALPLPESEWVYSCSETFCVCD